MASMRATPQTMQQIANDLGLNRVTVSLVINGHAEARGVAEKTVTRVNDYLRKVGYVASRGAVALRTGKRSGVGILHSGHLYSHLTQAFNRLTDEFAGSPQGIEVVIRSSSAILDGLREMVSRGVERVIWIHGGGMRAIADDIREEAIALAGRLRAVIYNYGFDLAEDDRELVASGLSLLGMSRKAGYLQMARFLRAQGHRHVLLADAWCDGADTIDAQLLWAMRSCGLDARAANWQAPEIADLILRGHRIGKLVGRTLGERNFSAVCFRDDEVAAGAVAELLSNGIRVPEDVSVISMDGHPLSGVFQVPLTTLAVPVEAMVRKTIQLVRDDKPSGVFCFPYKLLKRASHHGPAQLSPISAHP